MENVMRMQEGLVTYRILATAGFGAANGRRSPWYRITTDGLSCIDDALRIISPSTTIVLPKEYCPSGHIVFTPTAFKDFEPEGMLRRQPYLAALAEALDFVRSAGQQDLAFCELEEKLKGLLPGLPLDYTPPERKRPQASPAAREEGSEAFIDDLLSIVATGTDGSSPASSSGTAFHGMRMQLEEAVRQCMRHIVNNPEFRAMESAWQGAAFVIRNAMNGEGNLPVELSLVSVDEGGIPALLTELQETDPSKLPNLILLDFDIKNTPKGMELLEEIIATADRLMVPVAASIAPDFFGIAEWGDIGKLSYIKSLLEQPQYAKWRKFQKLGGASWAMLFLNRFPARPLHTGIDIGKERIELKEKKQPWISPVCGYGALAAMSAATTGWPMAAENHREFQLESIPLQDDDPIPLEMLIPDDRITQLLESGFNPFSARKRDDAIFLTGLSTINGKPAGFQIFFGTLVAFLIRLQESIEPGNSDIAAKVRSQLEAFLTRGGSKCPDDLEVSLSYDAGSGADIMSIAFTPPPSIIRAERLELNLRW